MTLVLAPNPRQLFLNPTSGIPASGFKLYTYAAGTTTKLATYTDATGQAPNVNPIILDTLGEADIWMPPNTGYKFVFSPPTDSDPPTNAIWTRDNINSGGTTYPTFASAVASSPGNASTIYVQGYYYPGDGGDCYWKQIPAIPYHSVYFVAADKTVWEPAVAKFDPRAFGAYANSYMFQNGTIPGSNLNQLSVADSNFVGFTTADEGKNIVLWSWPCAQTLVNTTIESILSPNTVLLTAAASGATTFSSDGFYGNDDTAVINACMSFCGSVSNGFGGPPPVAFRNSSQFNSAGAGAHTLYLRSLDRNTSRYGISSPILPINSFSMECDENACLFALGTFAANSAMISQNDPTKEIALTLDNVTLQGNGFASVGVGPINGNYFTIRNGIKIYNCTTSGIVMGNNSGVSQSTWSVNGKVHIEGISTSMPGYVNNASGIGWNIVTAGDGKCTGDVEIINYRAGFSINSGDVDFTGQCHVWTDINGGYLTQGAALSSEDINFAKLTIDSPWGPSGTTCYGVIIGGNSCNINHYACYLHVGAAPTLDNTVIPIQYKNENFGQTFGPGSRLGSRIDSVYAQTNDPAVKFAQVIDAGPASNVWLDIGSINTDGNYYDIGWATQEQRALASMAANSGSHAQVIQSYGKNIQAGSTGALWYPIQIASQIAFWLDPNIVGNNAQATSWAAGSLDLDANSNARNWYSRLGKARLTQSDLNQRPNFSFTSWTGTAGGVTVPALSGLTFNGTTDAMMIDDLINNQTDVRIFCCVIPGSSSTATTGPIFAFNNPTVGGGTLEMAGAGNKVYFANDAGASNNVTVTPGVPCLITGIWSTSGSDGTTGIFGRLNGGTNTSTTTFAYANKSMGMGGTVQNQAVQNPINFTIGPVIVVTGNMTLTEEQVVEGYLAWQFFGNTGGHSAILPSGHPYYSAAPLANAVA